LNKIMYTFDYIKLTLKNAYIITLLYACSLSSLFLNLYMLPRPSPTVEAQRSFPQPGLRTMHIHRTVHALTTQTILIHRAGCTKLTTSFRRRVGRPLISARQRCPFLPLRQDRIQIYPCSSLSLYTRRQGLTCYQFYPE
jgi:hypothetical protein